MSRPRDRHAHGGREDVHGRLAPRGERRHVSRGPRRRPAAHHRGGVAARGAGRGPLQRARPCDHPRGGAQPHRSRAGRAGGAAPRGGRGPSRPRLRGTRPGGGGRHRNRGRRLERGQHRDRSVRELLARPRRDRPFRDGDPVYERSLLSPARDRLLVALHRGARAARPCDRRAVHAGPRPHGRRLPPGRGHGRRCVRCRGRIRLGRAVAPRWATEGGVHRAEPPARRLAALRGRADRSAARGQPRCARPELCGARGIGEAIHAGGARERVAAHALRGLRRGRDGLRGPVQRGHGLEVRERGVPLRRPRLLHVGHAAGGACVPPEARRPPRARRGDLRLPRPDAPGRRRRGLGALPPRDGGPARRAPRERGHRTGLRLRGAEAGAAGDGRGRGRGACGRRTAGAEDGRGGGRGRRGLRGGAGGGRPRRPLPNQTPEAHHRPPQPAGEVRRRVLRLPLRGPGVHAHARRRAGRARHRHLSPAHGEAPA